MNSSSMIIKIAGFAVGGYVVARLTGASPLLTATGFAIVLIVDAIFTVVIEKMYKSDESPANKSVKNAIYIGWYFLESSALIVGCKLAGIISFLGVGIISAIPIVVTINACYKHTKGEYVCIDLKKTWL